MAGHWYGGGVRFIYSQFTLTQGRGCSLGFHLRVGVLPTPPWVSPESCLLFPESLQGAEILQGLSNALQGERWHILSFLTRDHLKCCFLNVTSSILLDFIWGSGMLPYYGTGKPRWGSLRLLTSWGPNDRRVPLLFIMQRHEQYFLMKAAAESHSESWGGWWMQGRLGQTSIISGGRQGCV